MRMFMGRGFGWKGLRGFMNITLGPCDRLIDYPLDCGGNKASRKICAIVVGAYLTPTSPAQFSAPGTPYPALRAPAR
jgi:hypothetical protein